MTPFGPSDWTLLRGSTDPLTDPMLVRSFVVPSGRPMGFIVRRHWRNGLKFGVLIYPDYFHNSSDFGHSLRLNKYCVYNYHLENDWKEQWKLYVDFVILVSIVFRCNVILDQFYIRFRRDPALFQWMNNLRTDLSRSWWRHQMDIFSTLLAICTGNHRSPVNSPHKVHWRGASMFSLIPAE